MKKEQFTIQVAIFKSTNLRNDIKILRDRYCIAQNKIEAMDKYQKHLEIIAKKLKGVVILNNQFGARTFQLRILGGTIQFIVL